MANDGWYYLHENGELIFKSTWPGEDGSSFVRQIWPVNTSSRENGWKLLLESLAMGARIERVEHLAKQWGCDVKDFVEFLSRAPRPTELERSGATVFLEEIAHVDPESFWAWLAKTPSGERPDFRTMPASGVVTSIA